jgi:DNA replication protein DnaC
MIKWEETAQCKKHGEYIGSFFAINSKKDRMGGSCPQCEKEKREAEEAEEMKNNRREAEAKKIRRRENAGITPRYANKTFETYIATTEQQKTALRAAQELTGAILSGKQGNNLIFSGSVGTGKTHLACSMIDSIIDKKRARLTTVMEIIRVFKSTWRNNSEESEQDVIDALEYYDLLIIDEVGVQFGSDTEKLFIFDVIDARYQQCKPTVIISNLDINGITDCLGQRVIDRLREDGGQLVGFDWASYRK